MALRRDKIVSFLTATVSPAGLADKLWVAGLINDDIRNKALVAAVTAPERIRPMIDAVVTKIKINAANFDTFISVLRHIGGLDDLIHLIESPLPQ